MTLTCPNCGNDRNFQVKTLQMHVVHLEDGRVEVSEESRPAVLEVLCDECESALKFEEFEDTLRKDCLLYTSPSPRDISGSRMPSSA